jgi:peptidoglycan/LPS O-acetylase OafA/YrhL
MVMEEISNHAFDYAMGCLNTRASPNDRYRLCRAQDVSTGNEYLSRSLGSGGSFTKPCTTAGTNIALWSLSNEFWYYIAFPLLVFAFLPGNHLRKRLYSGLAVTAILFPIGGHGTLLFLPWLLGALLSVSPKRLSDRSSSVLLAGFTVGIAPFMLLLRRCPLDVRVAQICIALYFGAMLYLIANRSRINKSSIYDAVASLSSNISYPLYLVHLPVLVFMCAILNRPWHQWAKSPMNFIAVLVLNALVVVVAYLIHLAFQRHTDLVRCHVSKLFAFKQGTKDQRLILSDSVSGSIVRVSSAS